MGYNYIMVTCYQVRRALSDYLNPKPYSYYLRKPFPFSRVRDFGLGNMGFSMGVLVYGVEVGGFLCGSVLFV